MKVRHRYFALMGIVWGPCLLAAAGGYAALLRPQIEHRQRLEANVVDGKERYMRAIEAAKEKDQNHLAEQVEALRRRIGDFVVSLADAPDLSFHIDTLANEAKLVSFGMRPSNRRGPETGANCERLAEKHVDLTFSGGFRHFATFLNTLERYHPALFVETFSISRPTEKGSEPQASLELAILVEKAHGPGGVSK
jgi:hypothetical protein